MEKPQITKACVKDAFESKFIKVYDLQYAEGKHYYDATRRSREQLVATKSEEEFCRMLPDAVTIALVVKLPGEEGKLLLSYEYRYPAGRFLLSPPAGLLDPEDQQAEQPLLEAARREILEETGIVLKESDALYVVNPLLFSTPGMTDESNAIVCAVAQLEDTSGITQEGAVGSECFEGFRLIDKAQARTILANGKDEYGHFYSVYTYLVLQYFISDAWKEGRLL